MESLDARPPLREERKVISALFADLVGSTTLAEQLDPEDGKAIVDEAIARIIHTVESLGGTVKDIAGDGVLALFGAPVAHEDDAERAVRAALEVVREIDGYAAEVRQGWGLEGFGVRLGIDTGPVVLGAVGAGRKVELGAYGDTVNVAARLQAAARPGVVLVTDATRRSVHDIFDWSEPAQLSLKGKANPVIAYEARALRAGAFRERAAQAPFVGRAQEFATAQGVVADVIDGGGRLLFITGEAGIGKSRLLAEIRDAAERPGSERAPIWLEGRCVSYGDSMPYLPFRDLLRGWLRLAVDEPEARARVMLRRRLSQLFGERLLEIYPYLGGLLGVSLEPDAAERLAALSPEALQYRTFEVVGTLFERLAQDAPLIVALEDVHWADPTSLMLLERLLPMTEQAALLLVITHRGERDHPSWRLKEDAVRELPHRTKEIALDSLSGDANRELLRALVAGAELPSQLEDRLLSDAEGNPFYMEELVRSLIDAGALVPSDGHWQFDHEVPLDIPPTIERVVVARIDRLNSVGREVVTAAAVLGRQFSLPLLEGVAIEPATVRDSLRELMRLDLFREGRRWPQPEYRFKHALIQEAAYKAILSSKRTTLHRKAAEWLERNNEGAEDDAAGLLAFHWLRAADEDKAIRYLLRAGDKARLEYALDEAIEHYRTLLPLMERRGEKRQVALVLFKRARALHTSLRFAEANDVYQQAFGYWERPVSLSEATASLRIASSFLPNDPDPKSAIAWPNIQLCMQLFDRLVEAWPERTIVPSLAERWEISPDGLQYVFHLREGLRWSDGEQLTADDVEFGIKRVLDPRSPGSSVAIYFVLENGQDYYLGRNTDADRIGVRALDDRTVEFRLVAPAPYFMSVMNRPDGGPQPRHAIEDEGDAWTDPAHQVVSGAFHILEREDERLVLERRNAEAGSHSGNVARVEFIRSSVNDALVPFDADDFDIVTVRYTPRLADLDAAVRSEALMGPAGWTWYVEFDNRTPHGADPLVRLALAHAIDRSALAGTLPPNLSVATGGIVPPALQGHTPDIAPRYDPDRARELLDRSGFRGPFRMAIAEDWSRPMASVISSWSDVLGVPIDVIQWPTHSPPAVPWEMAWIVATGWLPGYPDPEYFLRLLLHSASKTNLGRFRHPDYDELIERARQERSDRARLELFHKADRMAVGEQAALIPLAYGRSMAFVKPWVKGWWEFGKTSISFADLVVDPSSPRV
ncbi:MAG: ABC transporter substrate-binding protein [Actinomycetota bacterium]